MTAFNLTPGACAIVRAPAADAAPGAQTATHSAATADAESRTPIRLIQPLLLKHPPPKTKAKEEARPGAGHKRPWRFVNTKMRGSGHDRGHNFPPMRAKLAIALAAPLVLLGGCGGSKHAGPTADGPVVPWISRQPSQLAERSPASTRCRGADLAPTGKVDFAPYGNNGGIAVLALRNKGKQECRLEGSPRVRLVKHGGPKQVNTPIKRPSLVFPDTAYPVSDLLAIRPGEYAGVTITWQNWCDPQIPGKKRVAPSVVRITLPSGAGHVDADYNAVPPCLDPSRPSTIGVSPFEPAKVKPVPAWTTATVKASVPNQPVHARRGQLLRFVVMLQNLSRETVRFDRCPSYVQQLVPDGQVEVHVLNCAAAKPIAPGKSEAFAMRIRVPKNAPAGGNGLFWGLDPFGAKQPQLNARATVDR